MKLIYGLWLVLLTISLILLGQAFNLQIIQGQAQAQRAEQNRFRINILPAQRGIFYDRLGETLVKQENQNRQYLYPEAYAHVLGYLGEADQQELSLFGIETGRYIGKMGLERSEDVMLRGTDGGMVDEYSADGQKLRTISQTQPIAGRSVQLSLDNNLQTLAYKLLQESEFKGAVIVSSTDGYLLALTAYPSFDPNLFSCQNSPARNATHSVAGGEFSCQFDNVDKEIEKIFEDKDMPMFNRAIAGLYPPASTFKIITSMAALQEGVIDEQYEVEDKGEIRLGDYTYGNWYFHQYGRTDGQVNVIKGLQRSNDIFFYVVGGEIGIDNLAKWAKIFGLGQKTNIIISGEEAGLVPTPEWKQETWDEPWYEGDTYITSIGQGNLQATPLQVQMMMASVASDGYLCQPRLKVALVDEQVNKFDPTKNFDKQKCQKLDIQKENLDLVKQGLQAACASGGTGWPLFEFKVKSEKLQVDGENFLKEASDSADVVRIPVACKTGTAETGRSEIIDGKEIHYTHAWFTTYAPVKNPEIVVTVLLEDAGQGSDMAAPIAREILKAWFEEKSN